MSYIVQGRIEAFMHKNRWTYFWHLKRYRIAGFILNSAYQNNNDHFHLIYLLFILLEEYGLNTCLKISSRFQDAAPAGHYIFNNNHPLA